MPARSSRTSSSVASGSRKTAPGLGSSLRITRRACFSVNQPNDTLGRHVRVAILCFHSHSDRSFLDDRELAVLSGQLRQDGIENDLVVVVLDEGAGRTAGEPNALIHERLLEVLRGYDLVAFQRVWRTELIAEIRAQVPGKPFVFCEGEHPVPAPFADYVATIPLVESLGGLVRSLERGQEALP